MDLVTVYNILDVANVASIQKLVLSREESGVTVKGFNEDRSVVVHHFLAGNIVNKDVGILRVQTTLSRLSLFNLNDAVVTTAESNTCVTMATIKQGRKKISMRFGDPTHIAVPNHCVEKAIINRITFTKETVAAVSGAVSALGPDLITFRGIGDEINIELVEPETNDKFIDSVGANSGGDWESSWKVSSFLRLVKHAAREADEVTLGIAGNGFAYLSTGEIEFILIPNLA